MVAVKKRKPATIQNTNESVRDAPKLSKSKISRYTVKECPSYILQCIIYKYCVSCVCFPLSGEGCCFVWWLWQGLGQCTGITEKAWRIWSMYAVCLLAVTMHGITVIIVKKSPIQDVLYGKWLEVHDQNQLQRKHEGFEVCILCAYLQLPCVVSLSL